MDRNLLTMIFATAIIIISLIGNLGQAVSSIDLNIVEDDDDHDDDDFENDDLDDDLDDDEDEDHEEEDDDD